MYFYKSQILQEDLPMFPLPIFIHVCCCYASLQASSPIESPQSSRGQLRLPLAPSLETPDWKAGLQAIVVRMFVSFLFTKSPHYRSFVFSFFFFSFLVASYPTHHSFHFKWSCLNLGSKSCGKYV